jgi:hypothetical protein
VSARERVQARVFAWSYAGVGDTAQTLAWLEKAYAEHSGELVTLKVSPAQFPPGGSAVPAPAGTGRAGQMRARERVEHA